MNCYIYREAGTIYTWFTQFSCHRTTATVLLFRIRNQCWFSPDGISCFTSALTKFWAMHNVKPLCVATDERLIKAFYKFCLAESSRAKTLHDEKLWNQKYQLWRISQAEFLTPYVWDIRLKFNIVVNEKMKHCEYLGKDHLCSLLTKIWTHEIGIDVL